MQFIITGEGEDGGSEKSLRQKPLEVSSYLEAGVEKGSWKKMKRSTI